MRRLTNLELARLIHIIYTADGPREITTDEDRQALRDELLAAIPRLVELEPDLFT
jgi:hypothetical protein